MSKYKSGLDYFSFDVDFFTDEKIEFISAKFGIKGEIIIVKLLCKIYRNGYYLKWGEDECLLFSKKVGEGITVDLINETIKEALKRDFFSQDMFKKYQILTSQGIQKRYIEAIKRRKDVPINKEYFLLKNHNVNIIPQNVNIVPQDVDITALNADIQKQSIVKYSKVKESIVEHTATQYVDIINYLNEKAGKNFLLDDPDTIELIDARKQEGFTLSNFRYVIDVKSAEWLGKRSNDGRDMGSWLRPSTLFGPKFREYLNQQMPVEEEYQPDNSKKTKPERLSEEEKGKFKENFSKLKENLKKIKGFEGEKIK